MSLLRQLGRQPLNLDVEHSNTHFDRGSHMKVGRDSVVIGNVPSNLEVGDGSVIIGATDANGNTIINQHMAVGRNAQAGPESIAIGAGANAGAGFNLAAALHELEAIARQNNDPKVLSALTEVISECSKLKPDKSIIHKAWGAVKAAGSLNGAYTLLEKISAAIAAS